MKIKFNILFFLGIFYAHFIVAQDASWEKQQQGSLENVEIEVVGNTKIQVPNANRLYAPIPQTPIERKLDDLDYTFSEYFYSGMSGDYRLRPRPVKQEAEDKLYSGYLRGGFGTFNSPLVDAYLSNKRSKEFSLGANFNYNGFLSGSVDGENSAVTMLNAGIQANFYGDKASLLTDARYIRNNLHYYGYPDSLDVQADEIVQYYSRIQLSTLLKNNNSEDDLNYRFSLGFNSLTDNFEVSETDLYAKLNLSLAVLNNVNALIDADVSAVNQTDDISTFNRKIFSVIPGAEYVKEDLTASAGLNVSYSNDTLSNLNDIYVFPDLKVKYELKKGLNIRGTVYGGIRKNTLYSISNQNLFIGQNQYVSNERVKIGASAKLSGRVKTSFGYDLGFKYEQLNNSHFFLNDPSDFSRFNIVYDTGTVNLINPFITLYFNSSDYYRSVLRFDTFNYTTDELTEAWHRPGISLKFTNKFNIGDKMYISFDSYVFSGIKALNEDNETIELDPVINMNTNLEYVISKKVSAFIMINNLLGNNYSYYYRYPGTGLQLLGGVSIKF